MRTAAGRATVELLWIYLSKSVSLFSEIQMAIESWKPKTNGVWRGSETNTLEVFDVYNRQNTSDSNYSKYSSTFIKIYVTTIIVLVLDPNFRHDRGL